MPAYQKATQNPQKPFLVFLSLIDNVVLNAPNTVAFQFSWNSLKSEKQQQLQLPPLQPPSLVLAVIRNWSPV